MTIDTESTLTKTGPGHELLVRLDPSPADIATLVDRVRAGSRIDNEGLAGHEHIDHLIPKPWGFEYRVYVDDFLDVWQLAIDPGHGTSMHVHPRKLTYLLCLGGTGVTETLAGEIPVYQGLVLRIAGGVFHSTRATGDGPLHLVEVEAPRNKFDLIRLRDSYQRENTQYEAEHRPTASAPLRAVPYLPETRMRTNSPDGGFRFEIRSGMDIFYRRNPEDLYHIPLGVGGVVHRDLEILGRHSGAARPQVDQYYLSLARS
jgi:mannose-6-phosphate isomerase-like protein (cupin superfamily)